MKRQFPIVMIILMFAIPVYAEELITINKAHTDGWGVTTDSGPDSPSYLTLKNNKHYNPAPGENSMHFVAHQLKIAENGKDSFALNNVNYMVYASGIAASITDEDALLHFTGSGSLDPSLTLASPGTYLIFCNAQLFYNAATFTKPQTCQLYLYRTNNKPEVLRNATTTVPLRILTEITDNAGAAIIPPILYTTLNADDKIALYGVLSAPACAGLFQATEASIVAIRLY